MPTSCCDAVALSQPDVALVDVRMPPGHSDEGVVAAERIRAEHPEIGVLLLSQYLDSRYAARLLASIQGGSATSSRSASRISPF